MRWPGSRAALALALLFLAACEGTDYSGALTLEVDSAAPVAAGTWDIASLGRLAVDWRVDNDGSTPAQVDLRAVATTSGAVHDAACEAMLGRARSLDAADGSGEGAFDAPSGTIPVVSDLEQPFRVDLAGDGTRPSWIRVRLPRAGTYRLVNDAGIAMAVVATGTSRPLTPLRTVLTPVCSTVSSLLEIALLDVDYLVRFAPSARGSLVFLVEEDCESARDVGRTCAGSGGTVASETFADLAPGASATGRFGPDELGIGDQVAVELACASPCTASLTFTVDRVEVDCLSQADCRGGRTCDADGYCVATASGCAAASPAALSSVLVLAALVFRARRRRRGVVPAFMACAVLALAAPAHAVDLSGQVYTEVVAGTAAFGGELGRLTTSGVTAGAAQGIQFGLIGARLAVASEFYLTRQPAPPFSNLLQTFVISAGPRFSYALPPARLLGGVDYVNVGLITNALTGYTGPRTAAHGIAITGAARREARLPREVELSGGDRRIFGLELDAGGYVLGVAIGVAGAL